MLRHISIHVMLMAFWHEYAPRECVMNNFETNGLPDPAELIRQYGPLVWKVVSAYLKNPDDIQECVNDVFCDLYLHRERYDPDKGPYSAFLSAAARNKAIDKYRKSLNHSSGLLPSASKPGPLPAAAPKPGGAAHRLSPDEFPSPEDMAEKVIQRLDLETSIAALKPEEAELIRMKYFGGMTIREIADSLELPYETVKKRHQRSLHKLRRQQDC